MTTDEYLKQRNAQSESTDSTDENADSTTNNAEAVKDLATQLKELKDVQDTAKDALKEYNKYGGVSYDTLQDLLSLQPEYLQYLINDNGQFEINKTTLGNLNQALANNYTQTLANSAVQDMYNYAMGNNEKLSNLAYYYIMKYSKTNNLNIDEDMPKEGLKSEIFNFENFEFFDHFCPNFENFANCPFFVPNFVQFVLFQSPNSSQAQLH